MEAIYVTNELDNESFSVVSHTGRHFHRPFHFHEEIELTLIIRGKGIRIIGNHVEDFKEGDLVLVGSYLPHAWKNYDEYYNQYSALEVEAISVFFRKNFLGEGFFHLGETQQINMLLESANRGIQLTGNLQQQTARQITQLKTLTGADRLLLLLDILNNISKSREINLLLSDNYIFNGYRYIYRLNELFDYILKNYRQKITLEDVASRFDIAPTSLGRYLKLQFGKTFIQLLNEIRINQSKKLLLETKNSVEKIAQDTGFRNLSNFMRRFKEINQTSPLQYRKKVSK